MLETLITSKTRLRLLVRFFINAANQAHMRGLAGEFNESTNAIRKELNHLSDAGYLEKETAGRQINYRANTRHPLFDSLQSIIRKYLGLDTVVEQILERVGPVEQVWLVGDYAHGKDTGLIEVVVTGEHLNSEYIDRLKAKLEALISREVSITLADQYQGEGLILYEEELLVSSGYENK